MNEQHKVGDICIGQKFTVSTYRNEMECEVIGGLEVRPWHRVDTGDQGESLTYRVRWTDGTEWAAFPHNLRRKPPKQSDKDWAKGKVREITQPQDSVHVASGKPELIPA